MKEIKTGEAVIVNEAIYGRVVEFVEENQAIVSTPYGIEYKTDMNSVKHLDSDELEKLEELEQMAIKDKSCTPYNGKYEIK